MKSTRRTFIVSAASSVALAACSDLAKTMPGGAPGIGPALRGRRSALQTLPVTIVDKSGVTAKRIYFLYYGQGLPPDNKWYHLTDADGSLALCESTDGKYDADYNFLLSSTPEIQVPTLRAARLYISVKKKLLLEVDSRGVPLPPTGSNYHVTDQYDTMWDFVEWTYEPAYPAGAGWNGNLTFVDTIGLPLQFRIEGATETGAPLDVTRGILPGGYSKIVDSLKANADFKKLVLPTSKRILAPNIGMGEYASPSGPVFSTTYYDSYVNAVWQKYTSEKLTVKSDWGDWTAKVVSGQLVFTQTSGTPKLDPFALRKPSSLEVFANSFTCASGCGSEDNQSAAVGQINAAFVAALCRSTLLTSPIIEVRYSSKYCTDTSSWYKNTTTNYYAKYIHANAKDGLAYAFGYDDTCGKSSFVACRVPKKLTITLVKS